MNENETAIEVKNLGKIFKIYNKPADFLIEYIFKKNRHKKFNALTNVSFTVKKGEVVGVLGRNGAGKSTLLKILAGTMGHSYGQFKTYGKISAILELGSGFHSEYSGRENIFMGGMCLGMSRTEITKKIDEIIAFSELKEVIDQPFKTYSSGMKARLTFSVAISVEPDIFIIDEALAAGDATFVAKCFKKISEICQSGTTVFFVTHSTDLVRRLCHRCLYLKNGEVYLDGPAENVSSVYDIDMLKLSNSSVNMELKGARAGDGPAKIIDIKILNENKENCSGFFQHENINIELTVECTSQVDDPAIWIKFTRDDGIIATSWLSHESKALSLGLLSKGKYKLSLKIKDLLLGDGQFDLTFALFEKKVAKAETAFYTEPMSIWDKTHTINVRRKTRTLATFYDQNVEIINIKKENKCSTQEKGGILT